MPNTEKYTVYECPIPGCTEESENEGFCKIHNVALVATVHPLPVQNIDYDDEIER